MKLRECEVMIFKNEKGTYKIGMSKKDRNNQYFNGYMLCRFKKGVELENKTKIKIKNAFLTFFLNEKETVPYIMITVPKDKANNIYLAGKYMLEEIEKIINEEIKSIPEDSSLYERLKRIDQVTEANKVASLVLEGLSVAKDGINTRTPASTTTIESTIAMICTVVRPSSLKSS